MKNIYILVFVIFPSLLQGQDLNFQTTTPVYPDGAKSHSYTDIGNPQVDVSVTVHSPYHFWGSSQPRPIAAGLQMQMDFETNQQCQSITLNFSSGVSNLNFILGNINLGQYNSANNTYGFVDQVSVSGSLYGSPVTPNIGTSSGTNVSGNTITGTTNSGGNNSVQFTYVSEITITYCNGSNTQSNPVSGQAINIGNMNWDGPLPVSWLSFEGKLINQNIQLNWKTSSETNNELFEIERSSDAINFEKIGQIYGGGTLSSESSYLYYDEVPLKGINYYRIKQTDFDKSYDYSKIIAVNNVLKNSELTVFPNPLKSGESLYLKSHLPIASYTLINTLGIVLPLNRNSETLETETLKTGRYILKVLFKNGTTADRHIYIE